jgi:hypothetical protein
MQDLSFIISSKSFQIYALTEYGNILFAYSPTFPSLSEQSLRILPISISFTNLKKHCFQQITLGNYTVTNIQGSITHNKQVVWGFFTKSEYSQMHSSNNIYFLSLFLSFLNCKPNTLHSILASEKDKTDRQGYEFSVKELKAENINTYNDYFAVYKEILELTAEEKYEECYKSFADFQGFIMNIKGDLIFGECPGSEKLKELMVNRGKRLKNEYRNELTVRVIKRI